MKESDTPSSVYRQIIDQLASETRHLGAGDRVAGSGTLTAPGDPPLNDFVASLNQAQRAQLSQMLLAERTAAIHDALAALTWWVECREVALTVGGVPLPVDESGMGLHGDFMGRCDNWAWPEA